MIKIIDFQRSLRLAHNEVHGTAVRPWMLARELTDQLRDTLEAPLPDHFLEIVKRLEERHD